MLNLAEEEFLCDRKRLQIIERENDSLRLRQRTKQ